MEIRFLLGPAGSGKTWRCIEEIKGALKQSAEGPSLILLAPRQATFQLERRLLADAALPGYTRLSIFSFARLAGHLLETLGGSAAGLLSEEGRVMVLRALLERHMEKLHVFQPAARLPGFARELSRWLRELQQQQVTPQRIQDAAQAVGEKEALAAKLHDTALLFEAYQQWLKDHALADADQFLPAATKKLRQRWQEGAPLSIGGLWMNGFAELTPQEVDFLAALAPHCQQMTLAFCLDHMPEQELPPLHPWAVVARTVRRCAARLGALEGARLSYKTLSRDHGHTRFQPAPALAHLESQWAEVAPRPFADATPAVRLVACAHPEAEVILAAREILQHVRQGGRFREVAVLMRRLETHAALLKRVFRQYEIPFFLDQREPMAHHPLAELTRYALRVVAWGWQYADWFGALKSGLAPLTEEQLDELENLALERGLDGQRWLEPWTADKGMPAEWEALRQCLVKPFQKLEQALRRNAAGVSGEALAAALRQLYDDWEVAATLQRWTDAAPAPGDELPPAAHASVWEAMQEWLETVEQALGDHQLPLAEWLPILESGLSQLSIGIIPPAMDQVLVGAVDRSRQPELKKLIFLGMNEGLFPLPPDLPGVLTEDERAWLENQGQLALGLDARGRQAVERYLGYIACTRASAHLVVTRAQGDVAGKPLNPSLFYLQLRQMFPQVAEETFTGQVPLGQSVHRSEWWPRMISGTELPEPLAACAPAWVHQLKQYAPDEALSPEVVQTLYGSTLATSISALETFAACPFQFFVLRGLEAQERALFAADSLRQGSFMHEVLARFHQRLAAQGRRWQQVPPDEAREMLRQIADEVARAYHHGVMCATPRHQFVQELLLERLQDYVAQAVAWMKDYQLEPWRVEVAFGLKDSEAGQKPLPAWHVDLPDERALRLRGRIDRLDVQWQKEEQSALVVVMDYKSRETKMDALRLHHGLDLQLVAYLNVVRSLPELAQAAQAQKMVPIGAFYLSLIARSQKPPRREDAGQAVSFKQAFPHHGRFDVAYRCSLDATADQDKASGPFPVKLNRNGTIPKRPNGPMTSADFSALLEQNLEHIRNFGRRILAGEAAVDPYQIKSNGIKTACDWCPCADVCRIDPWRHPFRRLGLPDKKQPPAAAASAA